MRGWLISLVLAAALAGTANADRVTDIPEIAPAVKISTRIKSSLTLFSDEVGLQLNTLSSDRISMRFNAFENRGRLRVGTGTLAGCELTLDSDIEFRHGYARVKATVDLSIAGHDWHLDLPDVDMIPRSYHGQRYVELRLPLLKGNF